jgi:PilZ domain
MVASPESQPRNENRKYGRVKLLLAGHLFDPQTDQSAECRVLNLSAGGAAIQCPVSFPAGIPLILYIDGFGRFQGKTVVHANGQLALQFVIGNTKRGRLIEMLQSFGLEGLAGVTHIRKYARTPSLASGSITRANGEQLRCDVLDISLDGVSLRTRVRPPIGEIVILGRAKGRVVRHHADGIALQYVKEINEAA